MIVPTRSAVEAIGSSVCGSPIIAILAAPPLGGAARAQVLASAIATDTATVLMATPARQARRAWRNGAVPEVRESMESPWRSVRQPDQRLWRQHFCPRRLV